jgi:DNA-binding MarR family transcriptional regulator
MTSPASQTHLLERPSFLLSQLGFYSAQQFTNRLSQLALHPRHFGLMTHLAADEGQSQQQLADAMRIHRNVMVGLVDELEGRGLVERRRHPVDRRAYALYLTSDAHAQLTIATQLADAHDAELMQSLKPSQRRLLVRLLKEMVDANGLAPGVHPGLHEPGG